MAPYQLLRLSLIGFLLVSSTPGLTAMRAGGNASDEDNPAPSRSNAAAASGAARQQVLFSPQEETDIRRAQNGDWETLSRLWGSPVRRSAYRDRLRETVMAAALDPHQEDQMYAIKLLISSARPGDATRAALYEPLLHIAQRAEDPRDTRAWEALVELWQNFADPGQREGLYETIRQIARNQEHPHEHDAIEILRHMTPEDEALSQQLAPDSYRRIARAHDRTNPHFQNVLTFLHSSSDPADVSLRYDINERRKAEERSTARRIAQDPAHPGRDAAIRHLLQSQDPEDVALGQRMQAEGDGDGSHS